MSIARDAASLGLIAALAVTLSLAVPSFAQDARPRKRLISPWSCVAPIESRAKPTLADAAKRAYAKALRETDDDSLSRVTLYSALDDRGHEAVLALVETPMGLGIYSASRDSRENDQWILVDKQRMEDLQSASQRCK